MTQAFSPARIFTERATVISQSEFQAGYRHLVVKAPDIARTVVPGQFVMFRMNDASEPLLPRPFSVYGAQRAHRDGLEILYKVIGFGTAQLAQKGKGERVDVTGPLGKPFTIRDYEVPLWLIGGGYGVGPMVFIADRLKKYRASLKAFVGARYRQAVLCVDEFRERGVEVHVSTDDGSMGMKGRVTDVIERELKRTGLRPFLYACGPTPMLRAVAELGIRHGLPTEVSLEETMGCGTGVCLSCVCDIVSPGERMGRDTGANDPGGGLSSGMDQVQSVQRMICRHGPVFSGETVLWNRLRHA